LDISVDGGTTFEPVGDGEFQMSSSAEGGNPENPDRIDGLNEDFEPLPLTDLPSTVQFNFDATGDDVVLQFTPLSAIAVHQQIFGVNAFQLEQLSTSVVTPSCDPNSQGDLDGNGSVEFADFLVLSANFGSEVGSHTEGDIDCSGDVAFADFLIMSANFGSTVGAEAASVPEPSALALLSFAGLSIKCSPTKSGHPLLDGRFLFARCFCLQSSVSTTETVGGVRQATPKRPAWPTAPHSALGPLPLHQQPGLRKQDAGVGSRSNQLCHPDYRRRVRTTLQSEPWC
jgi:hypothetical protein